VTSSPVTAAIPVVAGPWSATLEVDGSLNGVCYQGVEILRGLAVVVRTNTWLTVTPETNVSLITEDAGFQVAITATNKAAGLHFSWKGEIVCDALGSFRYSFKGVSHGISSTNRIGLVALHSLNWAGRSCEITHSDGSVATTTYPELISPHQPMKDIKHLYQDLDSNQRLTISFAGDIFEMEDQRNWTDASFKTYSRPLELPFPYELREAEVVEQSISLSVSPPLLLPTTSRNSNSAQLPAKRVLDLAKKGETFPMPLIGLGTDPTNPKQLSKELLDELQPSHLRVDVVAADSELRGAELLKKVLSLSIPVELALHVGNDPQRALEQLSAVEFGDLLSALLVYDLTSSATTRKSMDAIQQHANQLLGLGAAVFVGTDDNFTELNRQRITPGDVGAKGLSFSLSPQIHDSRNKAIIETAESLPAIIATARSFSMGSAIAISPITFKARRNIHVPGRQIDRLGRDEDSVDDRWGEMFSALWLVKSLVPLIQGRVDRITVAECLGPRGIISNEDATSGMRSPLAKTWHWLSQKRSVITIGSLDSDLLVLADLSKKDGLVINSSASAANISLQGWPGSAPLLVPAHTIIRLDANE
jgi:hypothetical protein